jgi:hypothetical protein
MPRVEDDLAETKLIDNSAYWTQQRRELARWFLHRAPSFVQGYIAAEGEGQDPAQASEKCAWLIGARSTAPSGNRP